jgi:DNA-binding MarR family transcriptional regulator
MFDDKLNKNEIRIMVIIQKGPMTISQLAKTLNKNISWISRNVNHLKSLGFVDVKPVGRRVYVDLNEGPMGASINTLISEGSILNIEVILSGPGMQILPLILFPGNKAEDIAKRSSLSIRTVYGLLGRLRKMGVVSLTKGVYILSERHKPLIEFIKLYAYNSIIKSLKNMFPDASIVWHWRDEFIFSLEQSVSDRSFIPAATSRLRELKYDIIASKEYYLYNPLQRKVSEEEALMQSYLIDSENPRIVRMIINAIKNKKINRNSLFEFANKYNIMKKVEEII